MKAGWMRHKKKYWKNDTSKKEKKSVFIRSEKGLIPTSFCWGIPPPSSVVKRIKGDNKAMTIPFDYG